ncbi:hypothetical protein M569_08667, partial [Genlisea aurea]
GRGGGYSMWGRCGRRRRRSHRNKDSYYYIKGEYGECVVSGRCNGMRLDCPLHCGGPCFYDCTNMCRAHCR